MIAGCYHRLQYQKLRCRDRKEQRWGLLTPRPIRLTLAVDARSCFPSAASHSLLLPAATLLTARSARPACASAYGSPLLPLVLCAGQLVLQAAHRCVGH